VGPDLVSILAELSGGVWQLQDYVVYAAGSDVDLMTHVVEAVAARSNVHLYPGDWFGFRVGCSQTERIQWASAGAAALKCLCIPSVRNGHVTPEMVDFLSEGDGCLLNLNLFPTMVASERTDVAEALLPLLPKSLISISFSRGFGLTASQLGVMLVHRDHPLRAEFDTQWRWFSYFYNRLAADAFMTLDKEALSSVDTLRRDWVQRSLRERGLPAVDSGSYYVKSFRVQGQLAPEYDVLRRDDILRLCFKPPIV